MAVKEIVCIKKADGLEADRQAKDRAAVPDGSKASAGTLNSICERKRASASWEQEIERERLLPLLLLLRLPLSPRVTR